MGNMFLQQNIKLEYGENEATTFNKVTYVHTEETKNEDLVYVVIREDINEDATDEGTYEVNAYLSNGNSNYE